MRYAPKHTFGRYHFYHYSVPPVHACTQSLQHASRCAHTESIANSMLFLHGGTYEPCRNHPAPSQEPS